jgi:hypothetical protein
MPRTTEADVQSLARIDADEDLTPYIETANILVTDNCTGLDPDGVEYNDETRLELIERWLSAHCWHMQELRASSEKVTVVAQSLQNKIDLGFDHTQYGQLAMRLDRSGQLAILNEAVKKGKSRRVGVTYLGTDPDDQPAAD